MYIYIYLQELLAYLEIWNKSAQYINKITILLLHAINDDFQAMLNFHKYIYS